MNNYEIVCIVHPDLDDVALNGVVEKVKTWITDAGGSVAKVDLWGKRQLAYSIRKQHSGYYVLVEAGMQPAFTAELDRNLRFLEPVLRHMITCK